MAKIGSEHLAAMSRQGLHELRNAMYAGSNVATTPEQGLYGTKTPGEVARDRKDQPGQEPVGNDSIVGSRIADAQAQPAPPAADMGVDIPLDA